MKAKFYRPTPVLVSHLEARGELEKYPDVYVPVHPATGVKGEPDDRFRVVPAGYVIEHPDAWRLVKQGTAEAADPECEAKCPMTPEQKVRRYERQKALEAGQLTGDPKLDAPKKHS
jgi:hypothetical protein